MANPVLAAHYRSLGLAALSRPGSPFRALPNRLLVVDVARQRMGLLEHGELLGDYPISTALNGLGYQEGSYQTPLGWHRINLLWIKC